MCRMFIRISAGNCSHDIVRFAKALCTPIGEVDVASGENCGEVYAELSGELIGILGVAMEQGRTDLMAAGAASPRNQHTTEPIQPGDYVRASRLRHGFGEQSRGYCR